LACLGKNPGGPANLKAYLGQQKPAEINGEMKSPVSLAGIYIRAGNETLVR